MTDMDDKVRTILNTYTHENLVEFLMDILPDSAKEEIITNSEEVGEKINE
jgi:hypothetical protein